MRAFLLVTISVFLGCNGHLAGSAASLPSSLPCAKEANPRPVCFSCKRAVQLFNRLKECGAKDQQCEKRVQHFLKVCSIECSFQIKKKDLEIASEKESRSILFKEQQKKAMMEIITWALIAGTGGAVIGVVIGFFVGKGVK